MTVFFSTDGLPVIPWWASLTATDPWTSPGFGNEWAPPQLLPENYDAINPTPAAEAGGDMTDDGGDDAELDAVFDSWVLRHGKAYHSAAERARSRLRFAANQKKLLELASPLAADALDALADLSPSERAAVRPTARGPPTELPPNMELLEFSADERKAALDAGPLDWVEKGAVTTPTSQGCCATCAYFAGVAAVEGAWKLAGHPLVKLSEQEEIDCYNNGGYAMPNMVQKNGVGGIARNVDAPLANHSDPNITGCRGITNCTHAKAHTWAYINGTRGSKTHMDPDVLAMLQSGPAAVSIDAAAYSPYREKPCPVLPLAFDASLTLR